MTETNRLDCQIIASRYGFEHQARIAQEECAELIQAISKLMRSGSEPAEREKLAEEMADVEIMIEQLKELIGDTFRDRVDWYIKYKINRTIDRSGGRKKF